MPTISQTIATINRFQSLPRGWHYGEGDAISRQMREKALNFLLDALINGIKRADAFPGVEGEICLSFYIGRRTLSVRLEID